MLANERGRSYLRPKTGTEMPLPERFQTRPLRGALLTPSGIAKFSVSSWTAAEAAQMFVRLIQFFVRIFLL